MVRRPRLPGPNDIRELNRRLTKAGDDLKDAYNQLRRGGAPIPEETMDAIDEIITPIPTETIFRGAVPNRRPGSGGSRGARGNLQIQIQESLDMMSDVEAEAAYMDLSDLAEETQDQELENVLASIGKRRPTQFAPSGRQVIRGSGQFSPQNVMPRFKEPKKKRKVSKYQKEFGKQLKKLKAKHPRTKITRLMKRAHTATRKAMK
jgi:hypothetical protein